MNQELKNLKTPMILVVDDDRDSLYLLEKALAEYAIVTCSPHQAVTHMQHRGVNLLITDYSMPEVDGLKLAKTAHRVYQIPSIIITGHVESAEKLKEKKEVAGVLTKPFSISELKILIKSVLDQYYS